MVISPVGTRGVNDLCHGATEFYSLISLPVSSRLEHACKQFQTQNPKRNYYRLGSPADIMIELNLASPMSSRHGSRFLTNGGSNVVRLSERRIEIDNALGSLCYVSGDEQGHAFRDEMTIV
jgi:hypothetical protein